MCLSPCLSVRPEFRKRLESLRYFADWLMGYDIICKIKIGAWLFLIFGVHESFYGVTDTGAWNSDFFQIINCHQLNQLICGLSHSGTRPS